MQDRLKSVLLVENGEYVDNCAEILLGNGFSVSKAPRNGLEVVQLIADQKPDVVLMEVFMSHLDALGVMEHIKKSGGHKPIFIITSAFATQKLESEIAAAGGDYFFLVPFSPEAMVSRIMRLTGMSAVSEERKAPVTVSQLEVLVTDIIHQIGVPAHIKGYHYVRESIMLAVLTPEIINSVTKTLYPSVAKRYNTTPSRVERAIRHAIEVAWDRGDVDTLNGYFGYTIHNGRGKPTNSEFVAMISDRLRLDLRAAV